ncbi:celllulose biosynthesis operon protein BcsF/YhjT [Cedecea neteri]|uniref:Celllulose biosynthesis operon protein BcsF/YhjT n=1 Tax=Cedecea neteri TaxID=158822 RepID=A0A2X2T0J4_9ENTR|nr:celllulose biosynthesis operon protein BcsF/YhjT [Cedecea neteri]
MMNLTDIIQLVVLCAIVFIPLGYTAHRWLPRLTASVTADVFKTTLCKIGRHAAPNFRQGRPST